MGSLNMLWALFYKPRKIIETDLNDHSRILNFFQVSLDDILNCPLEMTSIMEGKETMQRKDKSDIPQQETPYQKRLKRRIHFSGQKLRENANSAEDVNAKRKLIKDTNKTLWINKDGCSPCGDVKVERHVEYSKVDKNHKWRIKDYEDYMVVDCRNDMSKEDYQSETMNITSTDVITEYEQLVDDIDHVHLGNNGSQEDCWNQRKEGNRR